MKSFSLFLLMSFSLSAFAQELKHEAFCKSEAVKDAMGENGQCSLVFTLNKAALQSPVKCTGNFMNVIPCTVTYSIGTFSTSVFYSCGADPLKPLLKQTISPEVTAYNVAALVTLENHEQVLVNDPSGYLNFSGRSISIDVESQMIDGIKKQNIDISLKMADWTKLTNVVCN